MPESDKERRMRAMQHLRVFISAIRANPADLQALPAGPRGAISDFISSAITLAKLYDPGNENARVRVGARTAPHGGK